MRRSYGVRGFGGTFALALWILAHFSTPTSYANDSKVREDDEQKARHIESPVYEGESFAGVTIGDSAELVEQVMGEAEGGAEQSLRYTTSGVEVRLYRGTVRGFTFYKNFRGKLYTSELGIGDSLADLEEAYGEVRKEREVKDLCGWDLDHVLLIRRGGPRDKHDAAMKVCFQEPGLYFFLDEDAKIVCFGVNRKTDYLDKIENGDEESE